MASLVTPLYAAVVSAASYGNRCAGGGISSIGVSWTILTTSAASRAPQSRRPAGARLTVPPRGNGRTSSGRDRDHVPGPGTWRCGRYPLPRCAGVGQSVTGTMNAPPCGVAAAILR
jgi:hypothetical protein